MLDQVSITVSDIPSAEPFRDAIMKGTDKGRPGLRDTDAAYYGAFRRDPDGNRLEAVCRLAA